MNFSKADLQSFSQISSQLQLLKLQHYVLSNVVREFLGRKIASSKKNKTNVEKEMKTLNITSIN